MMTLHTEIELNDQWLHKIDDTYISRWLVFSSPFIKRVLKRRYLHATLEIHFVQVFSHCLLRERNRLYELQQLLNRMTQESLVQIKQKLTFLKDKIALRGSAKLMEDAATQTLSARVPVFTPVGMHFVDLLEIADQVHRYNHQCWISGWISDEERNHIDLQYRTIVNRFLNHLHTLMRHTLNVIQIAQQTQSLSEGAQHAWLLSQQYFKDQLSSSPKWSIKHSSKLTKDEMPWLAPSDLIEVWDDAEGVSA